MFPRALVAALAMSCLTQAAAQEDLPVDPQSGLIIDRDWELVRANCSACHSTSLVVQNRMSAAAWLSTIRWMQEKNNLWSLGDSEDRIIAYLEKHYGVPERQVRRKPLDQPPLDEEDHSP